MAAAPPLLERLALCNDVVFAQQLLDFRFGAVAKALEACTTSGDLLEAAADRWPERAAVLHGSTVWTFADLDRHANRVAHWGAAVLRLAPGDAVCLSMLNRPEFLAAYLGLAKLGCVVAMLNTGLRGPSLAHCIRAAPNAKAWLFESTCAPQVEELVSTGLLAPSIRLAELSTTAGSLQVAGALDVRAGLAATSTARVDRAAWHGAVRRRPRRA